MRSLGTLGDDFCEAYDINHSSQVVGVSNLSDNTYRAFLWEDGDGMLNLGTLPGGDFSSAYGINNSGQVVGTSEKSNGPVVAYLWEDGVMQNLNDLIDPASGWDLIDAYALNDAGQILGYGGRAGTGGELFLLTPVAPVPLPAVVWLMLSGLASLGWLKYRRAAAC